MVAVQGVAGRFSYKERWIIIERKAEKLLWGTAAREYARLLWG